jgi:hypothetical protein
MRKNRFSVSNELFAVEKAVEKRANLGAECEPFKNEML